VQRQVKKLTQLRFPKTGYGTLPQIVLDRLIFQQITGTAPLGILEESTAGLKIDPGGPDAFWSTRQRVHCSSSWQDLELRLDSDRETP
jgi:hypothetical protein